MDGIILCNLLAEKIPQEQFQVWGIEVHWMAKEYDTPENNAIVADVVANYSKLAPVAEKAISDEAAREALIDAKMLEMAEARVPLTMNEPDVFISQQKNILSEIREQQIDALIEGDTDTLEVLKEKAKKIKDKIKHIGG